MLLVILERSVEAQIWVIASVQHLTRIVMKMPYPGKQGDKTYGQKSPPSPHCHTFYAAHPLLPALKHEEVSPHVFIHSLTTGSYMLQHPHGSYMLQHPHGTGRRLPL